MQIVSIHFTHDCTLVLYKQLIKTGSVLLLLPLFSVLGFPFYEDTGHGRAAKHQLYIIAIEALYAPMSSPHVVVSAKHCRLGRAFFTTAGLQQNALSVSANLHLWTMLDGHQVF